MLDMFGIVAHAEEAATEVASAAADGTAQVASTAGSTISFVLMMVAMVAVFYFLIIRPQRKKDKAVKDMLASLKVGDRICTIGGIYGTVTALKDDTVTLSIGSAQNTVVFSRWAIRSVENKAVENDADPAV